MEAAEHMESEAGETGAGSAGNDSASGIKGTRALRRLRERVERVALELRALREENASLQERIAELEASPGIERSEGNVAYMLDADPDSLKKKVEGFIQAIDQYLEDNGTP
jgi:hypothetical protein